MCDEQSLLGEKLTGHDPNDSHGANLAQRGSITIDPKCEQEINQELSDLRRPTQDHHRDRVDKIRAQGS
jgi:hypothetical protein